MKRVRLVIGSLLPIMVGLVVLSLVSYHVTVPEKSSDTSGKTVEVYTNEEVFSGQSGTSQKETNVHKLVKSGARKLFTHTKNK